jgi:hypothetical protein
MITRLALLSAMVWLRPMLSLISTRSRGRVLHFDETMVHQLLGKAGFYSANMVVNNVHRRKVRTFIERLSVASGE